MRLVLVLLFAIIACATAFNVAMPAVRVAATRQSPSAISMGYVPDGLSPAEWESMKKKNADDAAKKKKYYKDKKFESLQSFMVGMEKGRKHTFAKVDDSLSKLGPAGARGVKQE